MLKQQITLRDRFDASRWEGSVRECVLQPVQSLGVIHDMHSASLGVGAVNGHSYHRAAHVGNVKHRCNRSIASSGHY